MCRIKNSLFQIISQLSFAQEDDRPKASNFFLISMMKAKKNSSIMINILMLYQNQKKRMIINIGSFI